MELIYQEGAEVVEECSHCQKSGTHAQRERAEVLLLLPLSSLRFPERVSFLLIKPSIKPQGKVVWVSQLIGVSLLNKKTGEGGVALGVRQMKINSASKWYIEGEYVSFDENNGSCNMELKIEGYKFQR